MKQQKLVPLYHQIYLTLRRELIEGRYAATPSGKPQPLPGELALVERFGASRVTVRRALQELEQAGLVARRHGSGTYPTAAAVGAHPRSDVDRLYDDLAGLADGYETELVEARTIATPRFVAEHAGDFSPDCLHVCMVGRHRGQPVHLNNQYIPQPLDALIDLERVGVVPILLLLQRRGVKALTTDLRISAAAADIASADRLNVAPGAPLITARRTSHDGTGATIEYFEAMSRPDLYGYKFRFTTPET